MFAKAATTKNHYAAHSNPLHRSPQSIPHITQEHRDHGKRDNDQRIDRASQGIEGKQQEKHCQKNNGLPDFHRKPESGL
jgi:hypothetical protein